MREALDKQASLNGRMLENLSWILFDHQDFLPLTPTRQCNGVVFWLRAARSGGRPIASHQSWFSLDAKASQA